MRSWSTTTEVSRKHRLGSAMESLIHYGIEVGAQLPGINPRSSPRRLRDHCARYEPARGNRPQLRNRDSVTRNDNGLSCLDFPEDSPRIVSQLALGNNSTH